MGLFSKKREFSYPDPTGIQVPEWVSRQLTDPGDLLRDIYSNAHEPTRQAVEEELRRVRFPGGGYDLSGINNKKDGPLYLLGWITSGDWIGLQVWACHDLGGAQKREMEAKVKQIRDAQGIPAAATWALATWSSTGERHTPSLDLLEHLLSGKYFEQQGSITNGMVIDSFKKWQRTNY